MLLLSFAFFHDVIWGGRLGRLSGFRRALAGLVLFLPFFLVFGIEAAVIVTVAAGLRRYSGWRPPWRGGHVILPMRSFSDVLDMFIISLLLLIIPLGAHYWIGLPLLIGPFVLLAVLIAFTYWAVINRLEAHHHWAELATGIYITFFAGWYFSAFNFIKELPF